MDRGPQNEVIGAVSGSDLDIGQEVEADNGVGSCTADLVFAVGGGGSRKFY
jgi:hypothetical protein